MTINIPKKEFLSKWFLKIEQNGEEIYSVKGLSELTGKIKAEDDNYVILELI
jgi:hypothetical protein